MTLKNLFKSLLLLPLTLALPACDDIDEAERWQPGKPIEAKKNVLIEDFTGQRCVNCPQAHDIIADIQATVGADRVIAVSIHGGSLAMNDNGQSTVGLAMPEGNQLTTLFGVTTWPLGMVDRKGGLTAPENWAKQTEERLQIARKVDIDLSSPVFDSETRKLTFDVNLSANLPVNGKLHVWLTESAIVAPQLGKTGMNPQYVHNHVFRAALLPLEGETASITPETPYARKVDYTLARTYWKAENLAIVAFVENETEGVLQVVETAVINNAD